MWAVCSRKEQTSCWAAWQMGIQPPHLKQPWSTHHLWGKPTRPTVSTGLFISSSTASASPTGLWSRLPVQLALCVPGRPALTSTTCLSSADFPPWESWFGWYTSWSRPRDTAAWQEWELWEDGAPWRQSHREHRPRRRGGEAGGWATPAVSRHSHGEEPSLQDGRFRTAGTQRTHQMGPSCSQSRFLGAGERECHWLFGSGCRIWLHPHSQQHRTCGAHPRTSMGRTEARERKCTQMRFSRDAKNSTPLPSLPRATGSGGRKSLFGVCLQHPQITGR